MEGGRTVITASNGNVIIEGETVDVLAEFTCIIRGVKEVLTQNASKETAEKLIAKAGQMAFSDEINSHMIRLEK